MAKVLFIKLFLFFPSMILAVPKIPNVESILRSNKIPSSEVSLIITNNRNAGILTLNSDVIRIPASVSKIFTAYGVLHGIQPGTKVKTQVFSEGKIRQNILDGNLCLKGAGDPGFVSETMWFLVNHFKRTGINSIKGKIIVDDSLFDDKRFDLSRQEERVDRAYDAPVGAMSFNWNSINVFIRPTEVGKAAIVFLDPENEYTQIEGIIKTAGSTNYSIERIATTTGDKIKVSGTISSTSKEIVVYKSISKPNLWAGQNLKSFLLQRGISVSGEVTSGLCDKKAILVAEADSKPIEHLVTDMNKFSNNYVAEMLTKLLASQNGETGTIANGMKWILKSAKECGVSEDDIKLLNPSGLTTENKIKVKALHKVLTCIQNDIRIFPEFISSLPISGIDGTLKNRYKGTKAVRWVRAKTGLLTGVTALAGYAGLNDGTIYTFVLIQNGKADGAQTRQAFDQVITSLLD